MTLDQNNRGTGWKDRREEKETGKREKHSRCALHEQKAQCIRLAGWIVLDLISICF